MPLIQLRREHVDAMIAHARETAPEECCGLIGGISETQSGHSLSSSQRHPESRIRLTKQRLKISSPRSDRCANAAKNCWPSITPIHAQSDPSPSETDVRLAYYPSAKYLIIGLGGIEAVIKAFSISEREQRWQQVEYEIAD